MERQMSEGVILRPTPPPTPEPQPGDAPDPPSRLAALHPVSTDSILTFQDAGHLYFFKNHPIRTSVTSMLKPHWPPFQGAETIEEFFESWKRNEQSKYSALIRYVQRVLGGDDAMAKVAISELWDADRDAAAKKGTEMHKLLQYIVEEWPFSWVETLECKMFRDWLAEFCEREQCVVWRSELCVVHMVDGLPLVAGQIDLLLKLVNSDEYILIDFKRTNPKKSGGVFLNRLQATQRSFGGKTGLQTGPFKEIEATDFYKYSAQCNAYAYMLFHNHGMDARQRMALLQIHPDLPAAHCVTCPTMQTEMQELFSMELALAMTEPLGGF